MNLPYSFDDPKREIAFHTHAAPSGWINYLSNGSFHAFVSQAGGGMAWWKSPRIFRITRYRMYNLPIDSPGFYIYIRHKDGTVWSPTFRPCETELDSWKSAHRPGSTTFTASKNGIDAELTLFMSLEHDALIWDLKLKNNKGTQEDLDIFAYLEFSQFIYFSPSGYWEEVRYGYYIKWAEVLDYNKDFNAVTYTNILNDHPRKDILPLVYFASNDAAASYSCSRDSFCGFYRYERNPAAVEKGLCGNESLRGGDGCGALHIRKSLAAGEEISVPFYLGITPGIFNGMEKALAQTGESLKLFRKKGFVRDQFRKVNAWWEDHLGIFQCRIPDEDAKRQINTWNPVQSVHTGRFSRTISSTVYGDRGMGFRDTCQDMLAQAYRKPAWAEEILLYHASMQFEDGSALVESWPEENAKPVYPEITRSDMHLWLIGLAYAVVCETGDLSVLQKEVPFLDKNGEPTKENASLWEHLRRAVEYTENHLGVHGFPLILLSDWNDQFGTFGVKGRGETLFVAQQLVYYLKMLIELAEAMDDKASAQLYRGLLEKQQKAIDCHGWEGTRWYRGYDDDGKPVGSSGDEYGQIWLETQVWAVLSQSGPKEKLEKAMDSVGKLLDSDIGIRIFAPGYPTWPQVENPKVNFIPEGCAENAGIFCHVNTWAVIAEAMLGRADKAWKYYRQLIPHLALQKIGLDRYSAEPYAYVSTIFAPENVRSGWANVTQMTGTAAWMDIASTQYLLGVRPEIGGLRIDPCIPSDWEGFEMVRKFRGCEVHIHVSNPCGVQKGVRQYFMDGERCDVENGCLIPAEALCGKKIMNVKVVLG